MSYQPKFAQISVLIYELTKLLQLMTSKQPSLTNSPSFTVIKHDKHIRSKSMRQEMHAPI